LLNNYQISTNQLPNLMKSNKWKFPIEFFNDIGWNMMELAEMQNPQREMFACFAEAMILEFEKCHTNFSWGRNNISLEKMEFIGAASLKHGFSAIGLDKQPKVLTV